ncbi:MAG: cache domain-containing sensor histidine kinase [Thainema sp.]
MARFVGQASFRWLLLMQIIVLSIPILLIGEFVALRIARTELLTIAEESLQESAARQAGEIEQAMQTLQNNLLTAAQSSALQSGSQQETLAFLEELQARLPTDVICIQLIKPKESPLRPLPKAISASTCGDETLGANAALTLMELNDLSSAFNRTSVRVLSVGSRITPQTTNADASSQQGISLPNPIQDGEVDGESDLAKQQLENARQQAKDLANQPTRLDVVLGMPIYYPDDQLRYRLVLKTNLLPAQSSSQGYLKGPIMVVAEDGTIVGHPDPNKVGQKSQTLAADPQAFSSIIENTGSTDQGGATRLSNLIDGKQEWVTGYGPAKIKNQENSEEALTWTIFAVSPTDRALQGLHKIQRVLVGLTVGLIGAYVLAALWIAQYLSPPIEKLGVYARRINSLAGAGPIPKNFRIRELNYLASALEDMMRRLESRANELDEARREAELANQLKSEFLATTSHELRTPLNGIIGCIRLVLDDCCDDEAEEEEFLQRAYDSAVHLLKIINDILDIARVEAGALSLYLETVDLHDLLGEVIHLQKVHAQQKGLQLVYMPLLHKASSSRPPSNNSASHTARADKPMVQVDRSKLKQVLLNVIYNAVKFTDQGSITLAVQISDRTSLVSGLPPRDRKAISREIDQWVVVDVKDTGIGIEPEQQSKLFKPFVMVDGSTTRRHEGTGLGLAISRNLMQLMGGYITLHSDGQGKGTLVRLMLPLLSPTTTQSLPSSTKPAVSS